MSPKKPVTYFGDGCLAELAGILEHLMARTVYLVVDEPAYTASGAGKSIESALSSRDVSRFADFAPNPKLIDINRCADDLRAADPDVVLAIGGGSAIDIAKIAGVLARHGGPSHDVITGASPIEQSGPPLVAIPTTAGTGSEVTRFALAYVDGRKYSVAHQHLMPDYAIVDPLLTHSMPDRVTAASGLDAFCQGVESIWAVEANTESIESAAQAVRLAAANLVAAVRQPTADVRRAMSEAAHLSGKAINTTKTTASHALSYALTSRYGVPHGMAVAISLGAMLRFNSGVTDGDCSDPRGAKEVLGRIDLLLELLGQETAEQGSEQIQALLRAVGAPARLRDVDVAAGDIDWLGEQVNQQRLLNNPRVMTADDLRQVLREFY